MTDTTERVEAIRARVAKATEGPWESDWLNSVSETYCVVAPADVVGGRAAIARTSPMEKGWLNAEFIAHARDDIPFLLAQLDEAVAERDRVAALVGQHEKAEGTE